ncbi:MAG: VWA domain-containing protein [Candidatus Riflebacteria bacterium]|nr:VWA domain-containing protein [Candidatus Riflebacteria bacterium]
MITLVNPWILSPLVLLPLGVVAWWRRRRGPGKGAIMVGMRLVALVLLLVALARPVLLSSVRPARTSAIAVVDGSLSIPPPELARARHLVGQAMRAAARSRLASEVVLFARKPFPLSDPGDWDAVTRTAGWREARSATDLGGALAFVAQGMGADQEAPIVLLTDGNDTIGDLETGLAQVRRCRSPVYPLPLSPVSDRGLHVSRLDVPERAFVRDTLEVVTHIVSPGHGQVRLTVDRGGQTIVNRLVPVKPGVNPVTAEAVLETPGLTVFTAQVEAPSIDDRYTHDNRIQAMCSVQSVPQALVIATDPSGERPLQAALTSQGIGWEAVKPGEARSRSLSAFATVILDNVPRSALPPGFMAQVEQAVREQGCGFIMTGGRQSFATGGYAGTPIEAALPVKLPTAMVRVATGVVILLDNSWSMAGWPLAESKRAAKSLMRMLPERAVGLYRFCGSVGEVVPLAVHGGALDRIDLAIDRIRPMGGTDLRQPLTEAMRVLVEGGFENRHVILLTDGEPEDPTGLLELADQLLQNKVRISTVRISKLKSRELLAEIAARGGGRYYQAQSLSELIAAFQEEVSHIVVGVPLAEQPFTPRLVGRHASIRGFTQADLPRLHGYVGTVIKDRAELIMTASRPDPVLAVWRHGLGVTAAFTTDVGGAWSREWVSWPRFPQFFAQLVRSTFWASGSDFVARATIRGCAGHIAVDAIDRAGAYLNFVDLAAEVTGPVDGPVRRVKLAQSGPGRYEGRFVAPDQGLYRIEVRAAGRPRPVDLTGAVRGDFPELAAGQVNRQVLESIASRTGGRVLASDQELVEVLNPPATGAALLAATEAWPPFALLALLVFFVEVVLRRIGVFVEAGGETRKEPLVALAERYRQAARDLEARGDLAGAQEQYLKAYSCLVKAKRGDEAKGLWERYRRREELRQGGR